MLPLSPMPKPLRHAVRAAGAVLLLAAPLLAAHPAAAEGPKTPQEAAVCRGVVGTLVGGSLLFGPGGVNAVCAVQPEKTPADDLS